MTEWMGGLDAEPADDEVYAVAFGMRAFGESVRLGIGRPAVRLGGVAILEEVGEPG